ncbi:TPA: YjeO family protein [Yersinia enterocolitica]|uniref:Inner membrane protein yjeO n=3 Tax=Yersinia TaxID=629 RepID=A0A0T9UNR1_YERAL|nr:YjeO family protein [Yersinia enterocolitica]CNL47810.1 Inner membrane protein yjeO [Yersinia aldovae]MBX9496783.1 YjeO family protein [Yersinia enterocolitica]CNL54042.1 Inner membrane protein yjeO [Yersinia aldovae]HDL7726404.1 YjeO family protein [Yersinia enterocolitica]HEI6852524.1 YjeO family protein [Yersinia enterocolitica]
MKRIIMYGYYTLCFIAIYLLSSFKEESFIDGVEIKNACIAHRALVVDDIRDFTVTLAILALIPCFIYLKSFKFKNKPLNILSVLLAFYLLWRFFIRLNIC